MFTFQAIGRRAWRELLAQHPPTAAQLELDAGLEYDPDTFPAAAIAAACVEPEGVTADAMAELEERLSIGQFGRLWTACLAANVQERATPK